MKKIAAVIISLIMTCAVATGCGSSDSSSSSSSSSTSSSAASDSASEKASDESTSEKTLAEQFSEKLGTSKYSLEVAVNIEQTYDVEMTVSVDGKNSYMKMEKSGQTIEIYSIDGTTYTLDSTEKTYYTSESQGNIFSASDTVGLPEGYTFVTSEKTDDGLTCETYTLTDGEDALEEDIENAEGVSSTEETDSSKDESVTTLKYYFDKDGNPTKAEMENSDEKMTVEIKSFTTENVKIELPDLSEWTKMELDDLLGGSVSEDESSAAEESEAESKAADTEDKAEAKVAE